MKTVIALNGI